MSGAVPSAAAARLADALEWCLLAVGAWLLWVHYLRPGARNRPSRLKAWPIGPVEFAFFLCLAFLGVGVLFAATGVAVRAFKLGEDAATVLGTVALDGGLLAGMALFHFAPGVRAASLAPQAKPAQVLAQGVATFLVALPLTVTAGVLWEYVLTKAGLPNSEQQAVSLLENSGSLALKVTLGSVAVLLVPVAEEMLFRGCLFRYARTRMPGWAAVASTSLLFGSLHVTWDRHLTGLPSFAPLVVLAAVFCIAYERTGSIATTIIAHALFNLNTLLQVAFGTN